MRVYQELASGIFTILLVGFMLGFFNGNINFQKINEDGDWVMIVQDSVPVPERKTEYVCTEVKI